jgi:hypothetical protein
MCAAMGAPMSGTRAKEFEKSVRIVWRDEPYRLECRTQGNQMSLYVFEGDALLAEERVTSVYAAHRRGAELCELFKRAPRRQRE